MRPADKTKQQLLGELTEARRRIAEMEASRAEPGQAERALKESEERYKALFEGAAEGIIVADVETRGFLYANPAVCRMLGYSEEELTRMNVSDIHPKESLGHVISEFDAQATGEKALAPDIPCLRKDGTVIHADVVTCSMLIDQRECNVGFFTDITERTRAAEALRESQERYRSLVEDQPDLICRFLPGGTLTYVNRAYAEYFGKTVSELDGFNFYELIPRSDRQNVREQIDAMGAGNLIHTHTHQVVLPGGEHRWQEWTNRAFIDEDGGVVGYQAIGHDVTDRELAQEALRDSEEKYRLLVESAGEAICTISADGVYLFVNGMAASQLGGKPVDFIGKTMWDTFPKAIADRQVNSIREVINSGKGDLIEAVTEIQGRRRWYSTSIVPIKAADGKVTSVLVAARDISELKQAQRDLDTAHKDLINAQEAERRHLAKELHDSFGQELVALKLAIQSAVGAEADDAALGDKLGALDERCADLIGQVRGICHGLYPATLETLGLVSAFRQLAESCGPSTSFSLQCPPALAQARFAPHQEIALFRIAQEAVSNAIRHGEAENIRLDLELQDHWIRLAITDDGCGFDPTDKSARGLGLYSMNDRARAVGGKLRITSRPGRTKVEVRLPLAAQGDTNE